MSTAGSSMVNRASERSPRQSSRLNLEGRPERIAALLDEVAGGAPAEAVVDEIVSCLRRRDYSLADLLEEVRTANLRAGPYEHRLAELVALCVDRTTVAQEAAIENMLHGFCEVDAGGTIIYANAALLELVPDCEGRPLTELLDVDAEWVQEEIYSSAPHGHHLDFIGQGKPRPVLVEVGAVRGDGSGYCIITDLSPAEEAKRRINDIADFAIMRLDGESRITYANEVACQLLHASPEEIIGETPARFLSRPEDRERVRQETLRRAKGESGEYEVEITPLHDEHPLHIRVRSMPETDSDGHVAGIFVTMARVDAERAAKRIQEELAHACDPDALFAAVVEHLKALVPWSYATLSVFAQNGGYSRLLRSVPAMKANQRWVPLPESVRHLVGPEFSCGDDIREFLRDEEDRQELEGNVGVQEIIAAGMTSWCSLSIKSCNCHATLTLMHERPGMYGPKTHEALEKMGAADAIHAVLKLDEECESRFRLALIKRMAQTNRDRDLAELVVGELARFYGWQNVSIFKVNAIKGQFEMLTQAVAPVDGFLLPEGYRQSLASGMLGETLESGRMVVVGDTSDEKFRERFIRGSDRTRSELCVPIRVQDKVIWILNIEDQRPNAFKEPDQEAVKRLMSELEPSLERTLASALLDQVLDDVPDSIVITDAEGNILKCNYNARAMLGGEPYGAPLESFFEEDSEAADAIAAITNINKPLEATLTALDGQQRKVLVRTRVPTDGYDRRVVLLQDRDKLEWQAQSRQLMQTLGDLAAQVRVPLSLASTFIRQIKKMAINSDPQLASMADHAIEQLLSVDLTYGRVMGQVEAEQSLVPIDVAQALGSVVASLPPQHRSMIHLDVEEDLPEVTADAEQFRTVLRSMCAYLLRIGDPDAPISMRAHAPGDMVAIVLFKPHSAELLAEAAGPEGRTVPPDPALSEAHALATLNEPRLHHFAATAGGMFRRRRSFKGDTLRLVLSSGD